MIPVLNKNLNELSLALQAFRADDPQRGLDHFNRFCQESPESEAKIYEKCWKGHYNGSTLPSRAPSNAEIANEGRRVFHETESPRWLKENRCQALQSFLNHVAKKTLKKIASELKAGNLDEAFKDFDNLYSSETRNKVYGKMWVVMGKPDQHEFGRLAFHDQIKTPLSKKVEAVESCIREMDLAKFNARTEVSLNYFIKKGPCTPIPMPSLYSIPELFNLFKSHQGLCLGEMHYEPSSKDFLIRYMPELKAQGVSLLFMEHFPADLQEDLDQFNRDGTFTETLSKVLSDQMAMEQCMGYGSISIKDLMQAARKEGIRIVGIDTQALVKYGESTQRMAGMNYVAAKIINREKGDQKFIALVGRDHLTYTREHRVPGLSELLQLPSVFIDTNKKRTISLGFRFTENTDPRWKPAHYTITKNV